jgi:hypothetical protein
MNNYRTHFGVLRKARWERLLAVSRHDYFNFGAHQPGKVLRAECRALKRAGRWFSLRNTRTADN